MEKVYKALNEVITCIKESEEYRLCISLKEKMGNNKEIKSLVDTVKDLQKIYVISNYDDSIKKELDSINKRLEEIPIYNIYLTNLEKVNEKIDFVKDSLNDYFYKLLNEKAE